MRKKTRNKAKLVKASQSQLQKAPLRDHLKELKRRLIYVAVSVGILSGAAYAVENHLIAVLLRPSHGEHFVYTSPMGGVNFLFSVALFVGIALSIPVIVFNLLKFILPLMHATTNKFIYTCSIISGIVAVGGILFGYYVGLPAALHFLLHQFSGSTQVSALISIQSYFSFVKAYMVGAAIMFQLPLILIIINRIKPLKPSQMFKAERAVILFAFIAGFIMNPTPNVIAQLSAVIPIVVMYQLGIGIVWFINRKNAHLKYQVLFEKDAEAQADRRRRAEAAQMFFGLSDQSILLPAAEPELAPIITDEAEPTTAPEAATTTEVSEETEGASEQPRRSFVNGYLPASRVRRSSFGSHLVQ